MVASLICKISIGNCVSVHQVKMILLAMKSAEVQTFGVLLLSARYPNFAARSRFVMFVCQSRFRNSILVTIRNSGRSVEESDACDNVRDPTTETNSAAGS